jgi:hypothetical protein
MPGPSQDEPHHEASSPERTLEERPHRSGWAGSLALAAGAALLLAVALQSGPSDSADPIARRASPGGTGLDPAQTLRAQAASAIDRKAWARCLELLDQAKEIDPAGEDTPAVQNARRLARKRLDAGDSPR